MNYLIELKYIRKGENLTYGSVINFVFMGINGLFLEMN